MKQRQMGKTVLNTLHEARQQAVFMTDKEVKQMIKFCKEQAETAETDFYYQAMRIFEQQLEINKIVDNGGKSDVFLGVFGILVALGVLLYFLMR